MRFCIIAGLLAGCFNPKYGSQTFYCHEDDSPACPDGQFCVNGRCQSTPGGPVILDGGGGTPTHEDLGVAQPLDLAMGGNPNPNPDLSMPQQSGPTGCHGLIQCLVACTSTSCESTCKSNSTANAQQLESDAIYCGQDWCVNYSYECYDNGSGTLQDAAGPGSCDACLNDALASLTGSQCMTTYDCNPTMCQSTSSACVNDLP